MLMYFQNQVNEELASDKDTDPIKKIQSKIDKFRVQHHYLSQSISALDEKVDGHIDIMS